MLPAPFGHLIGHSPFLRGLGPPPILVLLILSLAASAVYELIRFRRVHPVSLWIGLTFFILDDLCATVIGPSAAWRRFAGRLVS